LLLDEVARTRIHPCPVWDKSRQTNGRFTRDDFSYDKERNVYLCPGGKLLASTGNTTRAASSIIGLSKVIAQPAR
jgi:hypothetical protein